MKFFRRHFLFLPALFVAVFFILTLLLLSPQFVGVTPAAASEQPVAAAVFVPGQVIVGLKEPSQGGISAADAESVKTFAVQQAGARSMEKVVPPGSPVGDNLYIVHLRPGVNETTAVQKLATHPLVQHAQREVVYHATATTPNDTDFSLQTHHNQNTDADIDSPEAWDIETGNGTVVLAVIDSGVDLDHQDLASRIWTNSDETDGDSDDDDGNGYADDRNGWDFVGDSNDLGAPDPDNDANPAPDGGDDAGVTHGTHVAGIAAARGNNSEGGAGVTWSSQIMPLRALNDQGSGTTTAIVEAINYATANGADVMNMSFGSSGDDESMSAAVADAVAAGVVMVAAVGNDTADLNVTPFYPACYSGVIGVAATDETDAQAWFSNYGSDCVDISAPGNNIYSTLYTDDPTYGFEDDYGYESGTSMASPVVAGAAALLLETDSNFTRTEIQDFLEGNADDVGLGTSMGAGRLNVYAALLEATGGVSAPSNLKAYTGSSKSHSIANGARTKETSPYFTWSAGSATTGVQGYYVYFGTNSNANPQTSGSFQTTRNFSTSGLSGNNKTYYLRIKTRANDDSVSAAVASFTYALDTKVGKPGTVTSTAEDDHVRIAWDADTIDAYADHFNVYRKNSSGTYVKIGETVPDDYVFFDDVNVRDGRKYYYKVTQVDDVGNQSSKTSAVAVKFSKLDRIIVGAGNGGGPQVRIFDETGDPLISFFAYGENFRGGVNVASCDLDGDGDTEVIAGAGVGGGPQVRTFDQEGNLVFTPGFFAYGENFRGGVYVSCGDLDGDGKSEIVTGTGVGGGPQIRVFDRFGTPKFTTGFFAYGENFRGGVIPAVGDLDGNGVDEIVTGTGPGGGPQVRVFSPTGQLLYTPGFFAYADTFRGGVQVATVDIDGNGKYEIVTVPSVAGGPQVRYFDRFGNALEGGFFAYDAAFRGGVVLSGVDVDQDGIDEILTGVGSAGSPLVRVFSSDGGVIEQEFYAFAETFTGGVHVAHGYL